ncbi:MAG: hypothetical protein JSR21_13425 [Proteobacteria bacterium]|nr:hypothetical protein [Pseudomonadota bacterium]
MQVASGAVIASRLFDVADAIDLGRCEMLWARQARPAGMRSRLIFTPAKAVAFSEPPLEFALPPVGVMLDGTEMRAEATARLYDFGVVRLALQFPADGLSWTDYVRRVFAVDRAVGPAAAVAVWPDLLAQVTGIFADGFARRAASYLEEDYLVGTVTTFEGAPGAPHLTAEALMRQADLAPLLSGEDRALSEDVRRELFRHRFSYYADDLAVLTWDRAFVYDPRGDSDVLDVLDVANAQLLEMRYYQRLLDAELPRMYAAVEAMRRGGRLFATNRFANVARQLYSLVGEVTELREKLDNALQITEGVYLARVYGAALQLFRVPEVSAAVDRKLAIIRDTYAALYDEASAARGALMEAVIVVLILVEVVMAVLHW